MLTRIQAKQKKVELNQKFFLQTDDNDSTYFDATPKTPLNNSLDPEASARRKSMLTSPNAKKVP